MTCKKPLLGSSKSSAPVPWTRTHEEIRPCSICSCCSPGCETEVKIIYLHPAVNFKEDDLEDSKDCKDFESQLGRSDLNAFVRDRLEGKIIFRFREYDVVKGPVDPAPQYTIPVIPETRLEVKTGTHLDLAYVPLWSLVELYRRRGDILFDKNVRLSLTKARGLKSVSLAQ